MLPAHTSALCPVQGEMQKSKGTNQSLGNSMANLEGNGGIKGGKKTRGTNIEGQAATVVLQGCDWATRVHESCCPPCSYETHSN